MFTIDYRAAVRGGREEASNVSASGHAVRRWTPSKKKKHEEELDLDVLVRVV